MAAGTLNAVDLLGLEPLVVDEFQNLNPMDLEFIDGMVAQGARVFVAGDDDQSIYSFRFASPAGIQSFVTKYPQSGQHTLNAWFRCTPSVLAAAQTLIAANPQLNRIPKNHVSLYGAATPPLIGLTHRRQFASGAAEARAVAETCRYLIAAGINPRDILVLLSNQRTLLPVLGAEFQTAGVAYEPPRAVGFLDSQAGRWVLAAVRIVGAPDDYVAHRVLLGLRSGVGIGTCSAVTDAVIASNLNYRSIFYQPLPTGVFTGRALTAVNEARALCSQLQGWQRTDTIGQHLADIFTILTAVFFPADGQAWNTFAGALPGGMTLEELRDYLWADTDEQQGLLLQAVLTRLNLPIPATGVLPPRVRVMTMHGAKGSPPGSCSSPDSRKRSCLGRGDNPIPDSYSNRALALCVDQSGTGSLPHLLLALPHGQRAVLSTDALAFRGEPWRGVCSADFGSGFRRSGTDHGRGIPSSEGGLGQS